MHDDFAVLLFDGECNLCNGTVQFILKRDPGKRFRFASLQSAIGQAVLQQYGLPVRDFTSFLLLDHGMLYRESTAALRVARKLGGLWPLLYGLIIIPPFLRNGVYRWVSRNRYKWFGKRAECWVPGPQYKGYFLD